MLMNQILDSPNPLHNTGERSCPSKRSASGAFLPTPPRTRRKGYRRRVKRVKTACKSNGMCDNNDPSEDESPARKKSRTLSVLPGHDQDEEDENAFWTGRTGPSLGGNQEKKGPHVMLCYRERAPVSPPPSRRQPLIQPARAASTGREDSSTDSVAPVIPPRRSFLRAPSLSTAETFKTLEPEATKFWPKRDSPNNPFLVDLGKNIKLYSEWDSSDEVVDEAQIQKGPPNPTYGERPTITYVFRGQKATFYNPLYGLAPEVVAASKLPIDHPDFEAAEACPPKRLFSVGKQISGS